MSMGLCMNQIRLDKLYQVQCKTIKSISPQGIDTFLDLLVDDFFLH